MGGIGKTTLARNVFDDSLVTYHFHTRAWITVSEDYRLREVLVALLHSFNVKIESLKKKDEEPGEEVLAEHVYKNLKGRTYFIVMDDMWSMKVWDDLRSPLHQMDFLNEEWSWNLLRDKVFEQQSCPPELERIGRSIAKSFGGLPLAIAVAAGILAKVERTETHWEKISKNISLAVATSDDQFSKILSLSYDHLPCHLKACFLYMGAFPEDHRIPVSKLTKLWAAEGFLKPNATKGLEELAEEYLEDLIKRNLVLNIRKRSNGKIRFCGLHDLLRDLCIRKAQDEEFLQVTNNCERGIQNQRRLSIHSKISDEFVDKCASASPIHSILYFRGYNASLSFLRGFRLLRVLDLLEASLDSLLPEITQLFHLRFLAFTCYKRRYPKLRKGIMLTPSISKLQNLQTLIIRSGSYLTGYITLHLPFSDMEYATIKASYRFPQGHFSQSFGEIIW
ncbi:putative late blight resistance proteinR1B-14 [Sesamum angolense]|uniref:Late blight resistance proteinR1B-14 n=1 Tax=Sesamum angolense TaxID=2727404 RepID=A0AAE1XG54_9LAMI|nr:putative late blight resistance proteinR1B-14 [Sesamum angolense]